jgi:hypothetical protein
MEWTGEASPYENPTVMYRKITGQIPAFQVQVLDALNKMRIVRIEGITFRRLRGGDGEYEVFGLSEPVMEWGPNHKAAPGTRGSFVQAVTHADADKIKAKPCGREFRIWFERDGEPEVHFQVPETSITLAKPELFRSYQQFAEAMNWR